MPAGSRWYALQLAGPVCWGRRPGPLRRVLDDAQHAAADPSAKGANDLPVSAKTPPAEWAPLADITESEKEYLIKAEVPEVKKEDVRVSVENGVLTLSGERKFEKEEKNKKYHRMERAYGSFVRSSALPDDADPENVKAKFKDGMLTVHQPKSEKAKRKQVAIA
jgi:HSP20 family molecular chaperone IbpA